MMPVPVLLTRPAASAARFQKLLQNRLAGQIEVCLSPLIGIEPCVFSIDLSGYQGVVFTSSNAVRVATELIGHTDLPAYCLGVQTTALARENGWSAVQYGQDAQTLITAIAKGRPPAPLLHLSGVHTRGNVAEHLTDAGVLTAALEIYDQPVLPLSPEAERLFVGGTSMIVPLFSPRSAAQFCATAPFSDGAVTVAISDAVAGSLTEQWRGGVTIAAAPTADAVIDAIEMHVKRLSRVERTDAGQ
jgi:uroporphyrinogen-III synthase